MELLKLVIVDDEMILLQGLLETYDWEEMGFEVVGSAMTGEQAIRVIEEKRPHVVLTDIRMKQISGLMVMEEIQKKEIPCTFIVLSAYRDFEYAKQACDLGAFAYLLKPIEDDQLKETMQGAYAQCMKHIREEKKHEKLENLLVNDAINYLQVMVHKYACHDISTERMTEIMESLDQMPKDNEKYITVCVDIDLVYKITDSNDYLECRKALFSQLEEMIARRYSYVKFENENGNCVFVVRTTDNKTVRELKEILEQIKQERRQPIIAAISKPYRKVEGIRKSYEEADDLYAEACATGSGAFSIPETPEEDASQGEISEVIAAIVNAVRKNEQEELKEAFVSLIYHLPKEEQRQRNYLHRMMLSAGDMLMESYGMTEEIRQKFENYYLNVANLSPSGAVDVCYKILLKAIHVREDMVSKDETKYFEDYMSKALAYIEEHLDDENLSIVSVASYVYLNPVYFGRVFKNAMQMTFKKYLLQQRMEKAKRLLEGGTENISTICDQVGIGNPSYFTHLFKQYEGKLPSEYKKEYEV